ncbi:hypothetical protein N0V90_010466 [Kalmusia sp. IMI 367209]|nr:hypothetical protein N0V90_010466 [Kalmusia sp. IMI 367209]
MVKQLIAERSPASTSNRGKSTPEDAESPTGHSRFTPTSEIQNPTLIGKTVVDGNHSVYHGGNDWHLVLQEISELKSVLGQEQEPPIGFSFVHAPSATIDGSSLLFTQVAPVERIEIISTLPPRPEVERQISWFFDRQTFPITVPPIIHESTLRREIEGHWRDPSQTNLIWLGLMFSILGIVMLAYHQHGEPPEYEGLSESLFQLYRTRTAQCLLRGDIARCLPYTVETLRLNATAELNRKDDNRRALWITTGVIVRAAINMGYHRDPAQSPNFSILRAEYRRRVWLSVISMDNMASFQVDFPRMIPATHSDTKEPRNLHDWELSEDAIALPPSRPLSEYTPVTYLIVKGRLLTILSRVTDFNSRPRLGSYEVVLDIDRALQDELEGFPAYMKAVSANEDTRAPPTVANFPTFSLLHMYHLGMCNLHRKFMARVKDDDRFKLSRERCVSSALSLLTFQRNLDPSFYKISQARQTFALAAMLLFLELELRRKDSDSGASPDSSFLLQALENSASSWAEAMHACDETWTIYQLLVRMLDSFHTEVGVEIISRTRSSHLSLDTSLPKAHFDTTDGESLYEVGMTDTGFDWATWDAFIEEANAGGPMY